MVVHYQFVYELHLSLLLTKLNYDFLLPNLINISYPSVFSCLLFLSEIIFPLSLSQLPFKMNLNTITCEAPIVFLPLHLVSSSLSCSLGTLTFSLTSFREGKRSHLFLSPAYVIYSVLNNYYFSKSGLAGQELLLIQQNDKEKETTHRATHIILQPMRPKYNQILTVFNHPLSSTRMGYYLSQDFINTIFLPRKCLSLDKNSVYLK